MGQEVSAEDGALLRGATIVADSREALKGELSTLQGKLSGLEGQWKGQGAVAFNSVIQRWNDQSTTIIDSLNDLETSLKESQSSYDSSEESASSAFSTLQSQLDG